MSELPSDTAPPDQSRKRRRLVILVITMGVLLVAGFAVMVGTIIYRISNGDSQQNEAGALPDERAAEAVIDIVRPAGTELIGATSNGNRLTLHFRGSGSDIVLVVDMASGGVISRLEVAGGK